MVTKLAIILSERQRLWVQSIRQRLKVTSETIGAMKSIKLSGLTEMSFTKLEELRGIEISISHKYRSLLITIIALGTIQARLLPCGLTLTSY